MNVTDYTYLLNKPNTIAERETAALENVLDEFPYFQSARALRLKGLYNQNSFKYNYALKVTAAHTTDRGVLFDFITSDSFTAIQRDLFDKKADELLNITVIDSKTVLTEQKIKTNTLEDSILTSIKEATTEQPDNKPQTTEEKLSLGTPLEFVKSEKHSFQEWLQLSRIQPIVRENDISTTPQTVEVTEEKKKKAAIIDKFIETSPKITPVKGASSPNIQIDINKEDHSYLMTETLARVYLEQKKYQKAIQAYEILILKYPEKSSFFADRISDIKILQQNN
ncbi:tetratricopeptide repeat protein [Flavobacterium sp. NG2]|uniref:tetratricopeptide repeat protein n=1 Tax=Flavobacterium sp. NG2 TaxID=3097547 RepID=UPI002A81489B|nr:tetratricopeptide repeat protein [Flavobacterium sp. NG2]WPR71767.1 tetratricopeptide repeat protein [Flavobacterium sp. NG2]